MVQISMEGRLAWIICFGGEYLGKRAEVEEDMKREREC